MRFSVAPLIYSRTSKIGFNPNFLVYPEEIKNDPKCLKDFRRWAHRSVESALVSTVYLQDNPRIGCFQNDKYIVIGICASAEFLCDNSDYCLLDEGSRMNHGFFGYVFKKESFKPFFVPKFGNENIPQVFKALYQYVIKHWKDDDPDPEKNSHSHPFKEVTFDFEETETGKSPEEIRPPDKNGTVCLPQERYYDSFPQIISAGHSFCSNMPSISDASNSDFDYVFIPKLSQVEIAVKKDATNREPEKSHEQKSTDEMEQVEAVVNKLSDEEWLKLLYSMIDKSLPTQKLKTVGHAVQSLLQTDVLKLTPTKASGRKNVIKEDSRFPFDNPKEQKWENPSMPTFLGNKYRK